MSVSAQSTPASLSAAAVAALAERFGERFSQEPSLLAEVGRDWTRAFEVAPSAVVFPEHEDEVVALTNQVRAEGRDCGTEGSFPPAPPVVANEELRCAARLHALDMDANDFFDHVTPTGLTIGDRVTAAGYSYSVAAENLADGPVTPDAVMAGWLASDGHCANIMAADVVDLGAAFIEGGTHGTLWVQKFASP